MNYFYWRLLAMNSTSIMIDKRYWPWTRWPLQNSQWNLLRWTENRQCDWPLILVFSPRFYLYYSYLFKCSYFIFLRGKFFFYVWFVCQINRNSDEVNAIMYAIHSQHFQNRLGIPRLWILIWTVNGRIAVIAGRCLRETALLLIEFVTAVCRI